MTVTRHLKFIAIFGRQTKVFARIRSLIMKPDALLNGISASDAAMTLGVAPAMAKEYLLAAEGKGMIFTISSYAAILLR
ncbi:hypothetical protein BUALT_Bualt19G0054900 [Buddleja alternifolia]|uniref:Uncharacterized protein n=1 Tax=Buddleja alternifolia TaxID=168488 RepID=A0AAV6W8Z2_9LAMI|nr:hypothetical protein BUALT_Bualt19G0054900 [Buddleja alternifolia]